MPPAVCSTHTHHSEGFGFVSLLGGTPEAFQDSTGTGINLQLPQLL